MCEINLAADQAMAPMFIDREGPAKQMDVAAVVAATQKDDRALERSAEVESEGSGETAAGAGLLGI